MLDIKKADQPRWLVILVALVGVVTTLGSTYIGFSTSQTENRLKRSEDERKTIELRTSLQLKVFESVDSTLTAVAGKPNDQETQRRYRAAAALVGGMKIPINDDAFIRGLMQALEIDAPPGNARQEIGRIKFDAEIVDQEAPPPEPKKTSSINDIGHLFVELVLPTANAESLSQPKFDLRGVSIDVFYCTRANDSAGNSARRETAKILFDRLLSLSSRGRLRLRELPESVNSRPGYGLSDNEVRLDPPEKQIADHLAAWANQGVQSLSFKLRQVNATPTPNYLSVFVC